jgi:hypothetical protein
MKRLKDDDGLAGALLRSADDDAPPPSSRRAIGIALGLSAAPLGALPAAKASAAAVKAGLGLKITAVVAIVGTAIGVHRVATRPVEIATPLPAVQPAPAPSTQVRNVIGGKAPAPPPVVQPPVVIVESVPVHAPPPPPHRAVAHVAAPVLPPPPPVEEPAPPPLADEIAQLEIALAAVRRHDALAALATLDTYDARFPAGRLAPEALAARVEATLAAGDHAHARELAAHFLDAHPTSPLARRVRALVEPR